jgi:acetoin utilization deacetylase AcuC-like enzyme
MERDCINPERRRLFYCDHHTFPLPPGHKFPAGKYSMLRAILAGDGFFELAPAPFADSATIELAHDPDYVRLFLSGELDARAMRRIGFPWSEGLVRRTLASVGGTLAAAREALAHGFGGNLAGGTHHAFRAEGSGFCVFNDLAVAVLWLRREAAVERAAILDLDVHQGDGTAAIFENDPAVLTVSLHGENNFPFHKQRSRIDIALQDRTCDEQYLTFVDEALGAIQRFRPGIILYQSGVDGISGDRLGRLALTAEGLKRRDRRVFELTRELGVPILVTLGGGYAEPLERTVEAHANTFRSAAAIYGGV